MRHSAAASSMVAASLVAALALSACGPRDTSMQDSLMQDTAAGTVATEMIRVTQVDLGKTIGIDMRVTEPMTEFMPKDTIFVSVATTGAAQNSTLMLMVTSLADSMTVVHENKTISPAAPTVTEFHFSKADGFKLGKYKAEVYLNGAIVQSKEFEIKRA